MGKKEKSSTTTATFAKRYGRKSTQKGKTRDWPFNPKKGKGRPRNVNIVREEILTKRRGKALKKRKLSQLKKRKFGCGNSRVEGQKKGSTPLRKILQAKAKHERLKKRHPPRDVRKGYTVRGSSTDPEGGKGGASKDTVSKNKVNSSQGKWHWQTDCPRN